MEVVSDANIHKFWKQFTTIQRQSNNFDCCFWCKYTQILKAIHNLTKIIISLPLVVSDANIHKFWKQFTTIENFNHMCDMLFLMQIYTNFESNSQLSSANVSWQTCCFWCKYTQILKAIHNLIVILKKSDWVVSDANIHKFWKQFTTDFNTISLPSKLFLMQIYTNFESNSQLKGSKVPEGSSCFWCKYTQILKAIHNWSFVHMLWFTVVSDANIHKFWKQFTTGERGRREGSPLFLMQIYTNFESNSQLHWVKCLVGMSCFWCKYTQILKAIHNIDSLKCLIFFVVSDANIHKFWKQFTTNLIYFSKKLWLFLMQIYTNFESNSQL